MSNVRSLGFWLQRFTESFDMRKIVTRLGKTQVLV